MQRGGDEGVGVMEVAGLEDREAVQFRADWQDDHFLGIELGTRDLAPFVEDVQEHVVVVGGC